jgi:sugar phosphate isomerase/epimerase
MDRRTFTKHASVAAMATVLPYSWIKKTDQVGKMGIQLYTVREQMEEDPKGTLRKLAEIGYQHVESAGYNEGRFYGMKPKRFKKFLDTLGMTMHSGHCKTGADAPELRGTIYNDWEMAVADAAEAGQEYITLGYLHDFERTKIDDYKMLAEKLNKAGELCKQYGIQFAYHNHDFEFFTMEDEIPYDVLLKEIAEENMKMELDLYWISKAGKNPFDYFKNHAGRFHLWHIKDMDDTEEQYFTEVGNGVIDWAPIFKQLSTAGMKYFYVEQDHCRNHHPLESVKISYDYLTKLEY